MIRSVTAFGPYPWRHPVSTLRVGEPLQQAGIQLHNGSEAGLNRLNDELIKQTLGSEAGLNRLNDELIKQTLGSEAGLNRLNDELIKQTLGSEAGINHFEGGGLSRLISQGEAVLVQREFPGYAADYAWISGQARARGKPIIYEIDDLLFELPADHPDRGSHYYTRVLWPMLKALMGADLATTTTQPLAEYLRIFNPNVAVLPNYLVERVWLAGETGEGRAGATDRLVIGYMGSTSHRGDLEEIAPALEEILLQRGERVLARFWGAAPPERLGGLANVEWTPLELFDYAAFGAYFRRQQCDIFIAPLADNFFNQCKSAIKFLEYSILGVPGVYSRSGPYEAVVQHGQNGLLAGRLDEWTGALNELLDNAEARHGLGQAARESVLDGWLLSQHAGEWQQAYEGLDGWEGRPARDGRDDRCGEIARRLIGQVEEWRAAVEMEGARSERWEDELANAEEALRGLETLTSSPGAQPGRDSLPALEGEGGRKGEGRASIILLTFNNLELTRGCLESILANTPEGDYELVVVDNGSRDETPEYLRGFAQAQRDVKLILNDDNLGFAHGNNQGALAAGGDILVFLNNDTLVTPGWLAGLGRALQGDGVGMAGAVTNAIGNQACIEVDYDSIGEMPAFAEAYTRSHRGVIFEVEMLALYCAAIRREVFEEIGPLDEQFETGMFEDDDYAMRLRRRGYRLVCSEEVFVHHWGGAGFRNLGAEQYWKIFTGNLERFEAKWGIAWEPAAYRAELGGRQLRGMVDDKIRLAREVEGLKDENARLGERAQAQETALEALEDQMIEIEVENARLRSLLNETFTSRGWKLLAALRRIRASLVPPGSSRERILAAIGRSGRRAWRRGMGGLADSRTRKQNEAALEENLSRVLGRHGQTKGVVVFPPTIPWDVPLFQRPHQLAAELAREKYLVFFCESIYGAPVEVLPVSANFYRLVNVDLKLLGERLKDKPGWRKKPVVVFSLAYNTRYLSCFDEACVVYEYIDELEVLPGQIKELERSHAGMVQSADVVLATAEVLYQRLRAVRADAVLVPNAVDLEFFQERLDNIFEPPGDLRRIVQRGQPIIGYYGALAKWFDYDLLAQAALARPGYQFVLIGPDYDGSFATSPFGAGGSQRKHGNVWWLGVKSYSSLPGYLKYFNAATIPFVRNEITRATSPLKLFEYMAGQKPVVSTSIPECLKYPLVLIGDDPEEYAAQLDRAIELGTDPAYREQLLEAARQNTWAARADQIIQALENAGCYDRQAG